MTNNGKMVGTNAAHREGPGGVKCFCCGKRVHGGDRAKNRRTQKRRERQSWQRETKEN